jgi:hypothetical protein
MTFPANFDETRHFFKSAAIYYSALTTFHASTPEREKYKKLCSSINNGMSAYAFARNVPMLYQAIEKRDVTSGLLKAAEMINQTSDVMRMCEDNGIRIPKTFEKIYYAAAATLFLSSCYAAHKKIQAGEQKLEATKSTLRALIAVAFWNKLNGRPIDKKQFIILQMFEEMPWWVNLLHFQRRA